MQDVQTPAAGFAHVWRAWRIISILRLTRQPMTTSQIQRRLGHLEHAGNRHIEANLYSLTAAGFPIQPTKNPNSDRPMWQWKQAPNPPVIPWDELGRIAAAAREVKSTEILSQMLDLVLDHCRTPQPTAP